MVFIWDQLGISLGLFLDHFGITKDQVHAVEQYYKHIQSGFIDSWKYDATTTWLNHYAKRLADLGVEMYILQGFANATDVLPVGTIEIKSNLFNTVCEGEFKSQKAMDEYYELPIPDQRINHMLKDNHKVLADALLKNKSFDLAELDWKK